MCSPAESQDNKDKAPADPVFCGSNASVGAAILVGGETGTSKIGDGKDKDSPERGAFSCTIIPLFELARWNSL